MFHDARRSASATHNLPRWVVIPTLLIDEKPPQLPVRDLRGGGRGVDKQLLKD